jgi:hypothetical protein
MPDYENFDDGNTNDEDNYVTVGQARRELRSEVAKALADISQFSAQVEGGRAHAIEECANKYSDFRERMPQMQAVLAEEKVLRDAISQAENNPDLQSYLGGLYSLAYKLSKAPSQPNAPTQRVESHRPSPTHLTDSKSQQPQENWRLNQACFRRNMPCWGEQPSLNAQILPRHLLGSRLLARWDNELYPSSCRDDPPTNVLVQRG